MQPNARQAGMWDMRMMSTANRMESPFEHGMGRSSYPRAGSNPMLNGMMGMSNEPDFSQFTYDPAMRQQAINAGVTPLDPSQVRHNAILPNTGFFGNHPRLSGAIEGGLFGALASHGGMTTGESIQGAIEGIVGGQQMRQGMLRQQFARPFEAQNYMEGIADKKQKRDLQDADIQHLRALNQSIANGDERKASQLMETHRHSEAMEAMGYQKVEATAPRNLGGGLYGYYNPRPYGSGTGVFPATPEQAYSPNQKGEWSIQENPEAKLGRSTAKAAGAGPWYETTDKNGKKVASRLHEGAQVPEGARLLQGDYDTKKADKADATAGNHRQSWIQTQLSKPGPVWMSAGVAPGDPDASQKLGKFYDENIATGMQSSPSGQAAKTYNPTTGKLE